MIHCRNRKLIFFMLPFLPSRFFVNIMCYWHYMMHVLCVSSILVRFLGIMDFLRTLYTCVEQQVAMFLNTMGHNLRNRLVATNYDRSGETVSCYFNKVLRSIGDPGKELIRPPSLETPSKIAGNPRWDPYLRWEIHPSVCFMVF
jgi:hypothetical protein